METRKPDYIKLPLLVILTGLTPRDKDIIDIVLVGSQKAERISILKNLFDKFDDKLTIGIDFVKYTSLTGQQFRLWDTAGQERFGVLSKGRYLNASALILFDDIELFISDYLKATDISYSNGYRIQYCSDVPSLEKIDLNSLSKEMTIEAKNPLEAKQLSIALLDKISSMLFPKLIQKDQYEIDKESDQTPYNRGCSMM